MTTAAATNPDTFTTDADSSEVKAPRRFVVKTWHAFAFAVVLGCAYNFFAAYTAHNMAQQGMCTASSASTDIQ